MHSIPDPELSWRTCARSNNIVWFSLRGSEIFAKSLQMANMVAKVGADGTKIGIFDNKISFCFQL